MVPAPRRRLAVTAVAIAATLGGGVAAVAATSAPSRSGATKVRVISPVDDAGRLRPAFQVSRDLRHATCQSGSFMTGHAYRCSTVRSKTIVLDPCWVAARPATAICLPKPWRHKVVRLQVDGGFDHGTGFRQADRAWGLRIGPKLRCLNDPGSVRSVDGRPLTYHCSHHRDVFGEPRHGTRWRVRLFRHDPSTASGYRSLGWHRVEVAWTGRPSHRPTAPTPTPSPVL